MTIKDDSHALFTPDAIAFDPSPALLGADTNGAAPQRIYGFHVNGEIYDDGGEPVQSYWLKTMTEASLDTKRCEFVMFACGPARIETVLGAIATAAATPGYDKALEGKFEGYANTAQIAYDEETSEDCIEGLQCRVTSRPDGGFSLRLEKGGQAVASIAARMTPRGIDETIALAEKLREWSSDHVKAIESQPRAAAAMA